MHKFKHLNTISDYKYIYHLAIIPHMSISSYKHLNCQQLILSDIHTRRCPKVTQSSSNLIG